MSAETDETTLRATVPETLVALLRDVEAEALSLGTALIEAQKDALTRALYPHVDEAHRLRRRYDEACQLVQSAAGRLERERDRVARAEAGQVAEPQGPFDGQAFQRAAAAGEGPSRERLQRIYDVLRFHPYGRTVLSELEDNPSTDRIVGHLLSQLQGARAENLEFRRGNQEWDEKTRRLIAERDALMRWQATARQVAQTLAPCYPTPARPDEHSVVWLAEHVVEAFDSLIERCRNLQSERDRAVKAAATAHHEAHADREALAAQVAALANTLRNLVETIVNPSRQIDIRDAQAVLMNIHPAVEAVRVGAERSHRLRPLLRALRDYVEPAGDSVPAELWHTLQERYAEAKDAGLLGGREG